MLRLNDWLKRWDRASGWRHAACSRTRDILEILASGMTSAEIVAEYAYLEPKDVRAPWPMRLTR